MLSGNKLFSREGVSERSLDIFPVPKDYEPPQEIHGRPNVMHSKEDIIALTPPEFVATIPGDSITYTKEAFDRLTSEQKKMYGAYGFYAFFEQLTFDPESSSFTFQKDLRGPKAKVLHPITRKAIEAAIEDAGKREDLRNIKFVVEVKFQNIEVQKAGEPGFHYDGGPGELIGVYFFASLLPTEVLTGSISSEDRTRLMGASSWEETIELLQKIGAGRSSLLPMSVYEASDVFHTVPETMSRSDAASILEDSPITKDMPRLFVRIFAYKAKEAKE